MSSLQSGVLLRLLEEMNDEEATCEDRKPSLLQITSIMPVLGEGNLWPNQGFSLRVSDASHAMYVSLPPEQDDLILGDKLQLGQFVYADRMEASCPVPVLKGIRPVASRHSQGGAVKDLGWSVDNLVEISGTCDPGSMKYVSSDLEDVEGPKPKPRVKPRSLSASRASTSGKSPRRIGNRISRECRSSDSELTKQMDKGRDSRSTVSTDSRRSQITKRRSWDGIENPKLEDLLPSSPLLRHKLKPIAMRHNPCDDHRLLSASARSCQDGASRGKLSPRTLRKELILASESRKISKSRNSGTPKRYEVSTDPAALFYDLVDRKRTEDTIPWDSLPSDLVNMGKEVLKQREVAILAAAEAMQEAAAAERLIRCLRAYTELQSKCSDDEHPSVDMFFSLQDDLIHSRSILRSLKTEEIDTDRSKSSKETSQVALDRKRNAKLWAEAVVKADLGIPSPVAAKPGDEPKRSVGQEQAGEESEEKSQEWQRGDSLVATAELANDLQTRFRSSFLGYLDQYLDRLKRGMRTDSNSEIVGAMLQIKRVSDWLDAMVKKEAGPKECLTVGGLGESEIQAYGRLRNKIYRIMLKQIEKSAAALEGINAVDS